MNNVDYSSSLLYEALSLFLFTFLLLFLQLYLVDFDHGVLVFAVVVRSDAARGTDQLHDLWEFVHFRPMSCVKSVSISQVYICPIFQQELDDFHEAETSSVVEDSESPFVAKSGVGARVQEHDCEFIVILFDAVMEGRFLANIVIFLGVGVSTVLEQQFDKITILVHDGDMERSAAIDIAAVHLCLFICNIRSCTFEQVDGIDSIGVRDGMEEQIVARVLWQQDFVHPCRSYIIIIGISPFKNSLRGC